MQVKGRKYKVVCGEVVFNFEVQVQLQTQIKVERHGNLCKGMRKKSSQ